MINYLNQHLHILQKQNIIYCNVEIMSHKRILLNSHFLTITINAGINTNTIYLFLLIFDLTDSNFPSELTKIERTIQVIQTKAKIS